MSILFNSVNKLIVKNGFIEVQYGENDTWYLEDWVESSDWAVSTDLLNYFNEVETFYGLTLSGSSDTSTMISELLSFDQSSVYFRYFITEYTGWYAEEDLDSILQLDSNRNLCLVYVLSFLGIPDEQSFNHQSICDVDGYLNMYKVIDFIRNGEPMPNTETNLNSIGASIYSFSSATVDTLVSEYCVNRMNYCTSENLSSYLSQNGETIAEELFDLLGMEVASNSASQEYDYEQYWPAGDTVYTRNTGSSVYDIANDKVHPQELSDTFFDSTNTYLTIHNTTSDVQSLGALSASLDYRYFYIGEFVDNCMSEYAPEYVLVTSLDLTRFSVKINTLDLILGPSNMTRTSYNKYLSFYFSLVGDNRVDCYTFNNSQDRSDLYDYIYSICNSGSETGYLFIKIL